MDTANWIFVSVSLFLGICALTAPYLAELFKRKGFMPNLEINFKLSNPFCHQTYWNFDFQPVYYFRFAVENTGRSQARFCEAVLEKIWIYDSSSIPRALENFSPVRLDWVDGDSDFLNLNPKRSIFCDIGHISSKAFQEQIEFENFVRLDSSEGLCFKFDMTQSFFSQPNCLSPGKYVIEVGIYSENANKKREWFEISWSGAWKENEDDMFKEIVIGLTKEPQKL